MTATECVRQIKNILTPCVIALAVVSVATADPAPTKSPINTDVQTVLFLGDSNTYNGHYIAIIEAHLRAAIDAPFPTLINLGLQSETASGLSEPKHPFPRPCVHERLDRALSKVNPDVVIACYGMNDAIYAPLDSTRQQAFENGMSKLIEKIIASGAKCIVMTPPAFDPVPFQKKGKLQPEGKPLEAYMWSSIYESYDEVMKSYSDWLRQQANESVSVIDLHTPLGNFMRLRREKTTDFTVSDDGVHINNEGHQVLAHAVLDAWGVPHEAPIDDQTLNSIVQRQTILRDAWISEVGHLRPNVQPGMPLSEAKTQAARIESEIVAQSGE